MLAMTPQNEQKSIKSGKPCQEAGDQASARRRKKPVRKYFFHRTGHKSARRSGNGSNMDGLETTTAAN